MRTPARPNKPRTARLKSFAAPVGGWIANRNLASPDRSAGQPLPQGATILDNWFPKATSILQRRGSDLYATLGDGTAGVTSMFSYNAGAQEELFASTATTIYNITSVISPSNDAISTENDEAFETDTGDIIALFSTTNLDVYDGLTGGDWSVVQFATTGGIFLVGVNGEDAGFIYDGTEFFPIIVGGIHELDYDGEVAPFTAGEVLTGGTSGATALIRSVDDQGATGTLRLSGIASGPFQNNETITDALTGEALANGTTTQIVPGIDYASDDLSYVWAYKNRLFFVKRDSLNAGYLPVDQIGGTLTDLPLGGVFERGGSLLFGATWSLDSGQSGGLSEQCIFVTTEGEVAVFQGSDPSDANDWRKVGVYRIGRPLGKKAWIRAGGDLVIATSIGFVPLSQAIQRDYAALSPSAVSYPIEEAWNEAVLERGTEGWSCEVWPESQMVVVSPPELVGETPSVFVANARTGAWARFTGWNATCLEVWRGRLFFGSSDGRVVEANVGGTDEGSTYTSVFLPLYDDLRQPASLKVGEMGRATIRSQVEINELVEFRSDFDRTISFPPPDAVDVPSGNEWGNGIWGTSVWGQTRGSVLNQKWQSIGGTGYAIAAAVQISSGASVPLDAELIRLDVTYQVGDIVS